MIISGGSRCKWGYFSKHLTNQKDNDRAELVEIRGLAADNVYDAFRELNAVASGTQTENFFYHANINPRDDETLTPEQWEHAVNTLEKNLGLEGQSRFVIEHEKNGRVHRHVIWSRIDADTMTAISDYQNYLAHQKTSRELEVSFGHEAVRNVHDREPEQQRPERRPKDWEGLRGSQTGIDPNLLKAEITELWRESDSGTAFKAALEERGYLLCQGDRRDFVVIDAAGDDHSLARRIEGVKAAEIRKRLADIDRETLPSVAEGKKRNTGGGRDSELHQRLRQAQLDKELAAYLRDRENPAADEAAKSARRAEKARQRRQRKESLLNDARLRRGAAKASRDALHDASAGLGRVAYTKNEARERAAHTPSLRDELQPYVRAFRNGCRVESPQTFFNRASEYAKKVGRDYGQAVKHIGQTARDSWAKYVQSRDKPREPERER